MVLARGNESSPFHQDNNQIEQGQMFLCCSDRGSVLANGRSGDLRAVEEHDSMLLRRLQDVRSAVPDDDIGKLLRLDVAVAEARQHLAQCYEKEGAIRLALRRMYLVLLRILHLSSFV